MTMFVWLCGLLSVSVATPRPNPVRLQCMVGMGVEPTAEQCLGNPLGDPTNIHASWDTPGNQCQCTSSCTVLRKLPTAHDIALVKKVQVGEAVCNSVHAWVSILNIIWLKLLPSYNGRDVVICERNIKHDICSSAPSTVSGQLWPGRHRPVLRLLLLSHLLHRLWQLCQCRAKPSTEGGTQGPKRRAGGGKKGIQRLTF